jgi:hypothetical protein
VGAARESEYGLAFVALMPRYVFLRRTLAIPDERHHLAQPDFVTRLMKDGVFINDVPGRFTNGYGCVRRRWHHFSRGMALRRLGC